MIYGNQCDTVLAESCFIIVYAETPQMVSNMKSTYERNLESMDSCTGLSCITVKNIEHQTNKIIYKSFNLHNDEYFYYEFQCNRISHWLNQMVSVIQEMWLLYMIRGKEKIACYKEAFLLRRCFRKAARSNGEKSEICAGKLHVY